MSKLQTDAQMDKSPEKVAALLCSENFLVAVHKQSDEVIDAEYRLIEQTDDRTAFEIAVTGYKHHKNGDIDKSGTNTNVAEYFWERSKQTLSVHYEGSGRILIDAIYRLQPEATGTRLSYEANIDVKIPVVGERIANGIKKSMQRTFDIMVSKITG